MEKSNGFNFSEVTFTMTDELDRKIKMAAQNAENLRKPFMVIWSLAGSWQVFPVQKNIDQQFKIVFRTDDENLFQQNMGQLNF